MVSEEPILVYPDPSKPYVLFTDASKYAWSCVVTQEYTHEIDGKTVKILHPISYQSVLFKGSQLNWACLTKEAYAIYISIKKLEISPSCITFEYIKGIKNSLADTMSQLINIDLDTELLPEEQD